MYVMKIFLFDKIWSKKKNIIIEFNELWKWYIIQIRRIDIIIYISIYNINLKITLRDHKTVLVMEIKNL